MSLKTLFLCVLAAVLTAHEARSESETCNLEYNYNIYNYKCYFIQQCFTDEINAFGDCLKDKYEKKKAELEEKLKQLMEKQAESEKKIACLNACGKTCSVDGMCYAKGEKVNLETAEAECQALEGGALIAADPPPSAGVLRDCLNLQPNDIIWTNTMPSPGGAVCTPLRINADYSTTPVTENCSDANTIRVCKITV